MSVLLSVLVELPNGAQLKLNGIKPCVSIHAIKNRIEQQGGLLQHTYRLMYLDAAPLEDKRSLHELDVVNGATLKAVAWPLWHEVVAVALQGDVKICSRELQTIGEKGDSQWKDHCAWCILYMTAHIGHYVFLCNLLKEWPTMNINEQSPCGWTALHAAARMGHWKAVCVLIDHGADVMITDKKCRSAADVAHNNRHKKCEQSLRFCEWNIKKYGIVRERMHDFDAGKERQAVSRRAHQFTDSTFSASLNGPRGSEYHVQIPNPVSVRHVTQYKTKQSSSTQHSKPPKEKLPPIKDECTSSKEGRPTFDYSWFDSLRAQQLVPTTHHIITYSDPSSTHLQPRSLLNPNGYIPHNTSSSHSTKHTI